MGEALHVLDHNAQAQGRLPERLKRVDGILKILAIFSKQIQALEDTAYDVRTKRFLAGEGFQLEQLGKILDEPRAGFGDGDYLERLRAKIVILRSSGTMPNLIKIYKLLLPDNIIKFTLFGGGNFILDIGLIDEAFVGIYQRFLHDAKTGGFGGILTFTTASDGQTFQTDASSNLSVAAVVSDATITVYDGSLFTVGDVIFTGWGTTGGEINRVASVAGNVITLLDHTVNSAAAIGSAVSLIAHVGQYAVLTSPTVGAATTLNLNAGHPFLVGDELGIDPVDTYPAFPKLERRGVIAVTSTTVTLDNPVTLSHATGVVVTYYPQVGFGSSFDSIPGGKLSGTIT